MDIKIHNGEIYVNLSDVVKLIRRIDPGDAYQKYPQLYAARGRNAALKELRVKLLHEVKGAVHERNTRRHKESTQQSS